VNHGDQRAPNVDIMPLTLRSLVKQTLRRSENMVFWIKYAGVVYRLNIIKSDALVSS
jgi:hypothetical protein